jgi:MoaA/NifB/PqqE/SkfB family radical SAM enzyme
MNDFEYLSKPNKIQFELSSMCNALCLGCVRIDGDNFNQTKSIIPKKTMVSIETIIKLLTSPSMATVTTLEFCGTIDEPLMHPDFFEILKEAHKINNNYKIIIHTNGSIRSTDEWNELADLLNKFKDKHRVLFSIDGIGETHEFYRQKTSYQKIIENAQAFINNNGYAIWQFLSFPWNEHQVSQASELSEKMRFSSFIVRRDRSIVSNLGKESILLKKTADTTMERKDGFTLQDLLSRYKNIENVEISCVNKKENMYFVSYDSRLWPCCFISNGFLQSSNIKIDYLKKRLYENYGEFFNDMTSTSIEDIVNSPFFKNDLVESWNNTISTGPCGKITRCAETCNVEKLKVLPVGNHKVIR